MSDDGLKKTLGDAAIYFVARSLPVVVQLGTAVALLRFAGPQTYVDYTLHLALVLALATVASAWLAQGLIRQQSLYVDGAETASIMITGSAAALLLTLPAVWLVVTVLLDNSAVTLWAVTGLYAATFAYLVQLHATVGRARPLLALTSEIVRALIMLMGAAAVILAGGAHQAERMLWISTAGFLTAALVGSPAWPRLAWRPALTTVVRLFRSDGLACAWVVLALMLFLVDRLTLAGHVSPAALAAYIFTADVTQRAAQFLISPLGLVLQPQMARATRDGGGAWSGCAAVRKPLVLQVAGTLLVGVMGFLAGAWALRLALGPDALHAEAVFLPLLIAALLWQTATLWQKPLEFGGGLKATTLAVALATSLQTGVMLLLTATYGIAAAAWGLLAAVVLYTALLLILAWRMAPERRA